VKAAVILATWTFLIWTTRIGNVISGDESAWQLVLPLLHTGLLVLAVVELRDRRLGLATKLLAFASVGVWPIRIAQIAFDGRSAAFLIVHGVLGAVSITLGILVLREIEASERLSPASRPG
jgi:hypothetical protein